MSHVHRPILRLFERALPANLLLITAYWACGDVMLKAGAGIGLAAPFWPSAGIAFAFVFVLGARLLPGVFIGSLALNLPGLLDGSLPTPNAVSAASLLAVGASAQAAFGALLVRRFAGRQALLLQTRQILLLLALAGPLATLLGATIGAYTQVAYGVVPASAGPLTWLTWWVGDAIGVLVFAPLTLMVFPQEQATWSGRRLWVALPALIGTALVLLALGNDARVRAAQAELRLDSVSSAAAADLERTLTGHFEVLESIVAMQRASEDVSREEFRRFTEQALERVPGIQALSWNPLLRHDEIAAFERRQRTLEGLTGYAVVEKDANGNLAPVTARDFHVVVGYIEPLSANRAALGFDINSNPVRAAAIAGAIATGQAHVTAPIDLVQETGIQKGVLVLLPVDNGGTLPEGFAVGVLRIGDLLRTTFDTDRWSEVSFRLTDITDEPQRLGSIGPFFQRSTSTTATSRSVIKTHTLVVASHIWRLEVRPSDAYVERLTSETSPTYLLSLLLVFFLLMAFLLLMTGQERLARREAARADYQAMHDPLTNLNNRRAFEERLTDMRRRAVNEQSAHVLMFLDLDGFKQVNDRHGHDAGDAVLRAVAGTMRACVRERDVVARIGGDEFGIILNNCPTEQGMLVATSIVDAIEAVALEWHDDLLRVSVSIGVVAASGADTPAPEELLRRADMACYDSKRNGRGQVRLYEERL